MQSQLTNLSHIKDPRIESSRKHHVFKARSVSYLFPSSWVRDAFLLGNFFEIRALRNLDDYVLRGVRNMHNSIETRGNLCSCLGLPVVDATRSSEKRSLHVHDIQITIGNLAFLSKQASHTYTIAVNMAFRIIQ